MGAARLHMTSNCLNSIELELVYAHRDVAYAGDQVALPLSVAIIGVVS